MVDYTTFSLFIWIRWGPGNKLGTTAIVIDFYEKSIPFKRQPIKTRKNGTTTSQEMAVLSRLYKWNLLMRSAFTVEKVVALPTSL